MHLLGYSRIVDRHQADRLGEQRIRPRRAHHTVLKNAPVKRLVLSSHRCKQLIGLEVSGAHPAQPKRRIGQRAMDAREPLVGDKPRRIDNDFAGV